jgi:CPA2 family monovalent cation:H+ antiporter-2
MTAFDFIRDLGVVILAAAVAGWLCQRVGLSVVVGYLAAGVLVGPHTPPFSFVTDVERINTLAELGLVFLMFSIGLRLSVRRLRSLGPAPLVAMAVGAGLVFYLSRLLGLALGLDAMQGLFFAGMLVSSSSAIVSKALMESGRLHERSGQMAAAVTVLEDVAAVTVLTLLTSYVQFGGSGEAGGSRLGETLGALGAFVVLLGVAGLLLVPWLLRRLSRNSTEEIQTLTVAGLLFLLAVLAQGAGYSLALGAFLLGAIVADTPERLRVERVFAGLRDVFSAVFFVAIGMMIEVGVFADIWVHVIVVALFAIVVRAAACTIGLVVAGQPLRDALSGGLSLTPLGEFAFITAGLGVAAGVLDTSFQPLAVGIALATALVAPVLTNRADSISGWMIDKQPRLFGRMVQEYQDWLERVRLRGAGNVLWQLSRKRIAQLAVGTLFVSGVLVFAPRLEGWIEATAGSWLPFPSAGRAILWIGVGFLVVAPLIALWRNLSAMSMLYAEVTTRGQPNASVLRPVVENGLRAAAAVAMAVWLTALLPFSPEQPWILIGVLATAAAGIALLWRRMVYWHSEMEVRLQTALAAPAGAAPVAEALRAQSTRGWDWHVEESIVPEQAVVSGASLGELALRGRFGCTVVGIERHGFCLTNPGPEERLFPLDRVLLLGPVEQLRSARNVLQEAASGPGIEDGLADLIVSRVRVPTDSPHLGRTLAQSEPGRITGAQVAGIQRDGQRIMNPGGNEILMAGDVLLVLGTALQVERFRAWLAGAGTSSAMEADSAEDPR